MFELRELTPEGRIQDLVSDVEELVADGALNSGQGNSLASKLEKALDSLERGGDIAAVNQLLAFIKQVQALVESGVLSEEERQPLIDAADSTIDQILEG